MSILILNETDILNAIGIRDLLLSVEKAILLQEEGGFTMPDRMHVEHEGNMMLLMPAFNSEHWCTKLVSLFPGNKSSGRPSLYGAVYLQDGQTGEPLALMNGARITALRTGAVGALGMAYTTPEELETIGIAGAGVQGFHQAIMAAAVRNIKKISIFDPFNENIGQFIEDLSAYLPEAEITEQKDIGTLVRQSEAIITATTSLNPVIPDDKDLLKGKHFIGIGSYRPEMREYPDSLFGLLDSIVIDTPMASRESGDIAIPLEKGLIEADRIHTLGKIVRGEQALNVRRTTFFKSVGMALFDLLAAEAIYRGAREKGLGTEIAF